MEKLDAIIEEVSKNGFTPQLVSLLKEIRPHYKDLVKDPLITRLLRMSYEHIEKTKSFGIQILAAMEEDEEEPEELEAHGSEEPIVKTEEVVESNPVEEFVYMVQLIKKRQHPINRDELRQIKQLFKAAGQK